MISTFPRNSQRDYCYDFQPEFSHPEWLNFGEQVRSGPPFLPFVLAGLALSFLANCSKGPTVPELQKQVTELQAKLVECQGNPMKDALEAFQTFNSTVDTGVNQAAYKAALIPLKVKVDRLPDNEKTLPLKKTVEMLVDGGNLWNIAITQNTEYGNTAIPNRYVQEYLDKYKSDWDAITTAEKKSSSQGCSVTAEKYLGGGLYVYADCTKRLGMTLISMGQENIKGFPKP